MVAPIQGHWPLLSADFFWVSSGGDQGRSQLMALSRKESNQQDDALAKGRLGQENERNAVKSSNGKGCEGDRDSQR